MIALLAVGLPATARAQPADGCNAESLILQEFDGVLGEPIDLGLELSGAEVSAATTGFVDLDRGVVVFLVVVEFAGSGPAASSAGEMLAGIGASSEELEAPAQVDGVLSASYLLSGDEEIVLRASETRVGRYVVGTAASDPTGSGDTRHRELLAEQASMIPELCAATPESESEGVAYRVGQILGTVAVFGAIGFAIWRAVEWTKRSKPDVQATPPPPDPATRAPDETPQPHT